MTDDRESTLSGDELRRYSRHLVLPEVGLEGQERLKRGSALLVGAGGLGSPLALYLAAAGVGRIGLVDFDAVDESNLQRQVLYGTGDLGASKVRAAAARLRDLNPHVEIIAHDERLAPRNALEIFRDYDVVADGADNFPTRYLVNDACVLLGKPNVFGSVFRFDGQVTVFDAAHGPCYRCLYPEPPPPGVAPSCAEAGVLGVLPGVIGVLQATEVVKILLGLGSPLVGRLLLYDALGMNFREMKLRKDPACPACGERPTILGLRAEADACAPAAAEDAPGVPFGRMGPRELAAKLRAGEDVVVLDVREPYELEIAALPGVVLIPIDRLPERYGELDPSRETVCLCRTGIRSACAALFLAEQGFARVHNLVGGLHAWADEVDPTLTKY